MTPLDLFPNYTVEREGIYLNLKSQIHIHKQSANYLKVYLYPVNSVYVMKSPKNKKALVNAHLRECLKLSKYLNTDMIDTESLVLVETLDTAAPDFFEVVSSVYT